MIKKILFFALVCSAVSIHIVPSTALAVVVQMVFCFLQRAVQVQCSLKAAPKRQKFNQSNHQGTHNPLFWGEIFMQTNLFVN